MRLRQRRRTGREPAALPTTAMTAGRCHPCNSRQPCLSRAARP
jgi:hypothetical protein